MKRILIAFDGSPGALQAIEDLKLSGLPQDADARVLSVSDHWAPPAAMDSEPELPEYARVSRQQARDAAAAGLSAAQKVADHGAKLVREIFPRWQVTTVTRSDSPSWATLDEVRKWRPSLLVAGSNSHSALERFFLGSVSQKLVSDAECSVRISRPIRRVEDHKVRVLIAMDGSLDARAAFDEALDRSWPAETEIKLVTIRNPELLFVAPHEQTLARQPGDHGDEWAQRMLEQMVTALRSKGLKADYVFREGSPRSALLDIASDWNADVIFLGACGWRHAGRWRVGAVPTAIASRAKCTVEIIRSNAAANETGGYTEPSTIQRLQSDQQRHSA